MANKPIADQQAELRKAFEAAQKAGLSVEAALDRAMYELAVKELPKPAGTPYEDFVKWLKGELRKYSKWFAAVAGGAAALWAAYQTGAGVDITRMPAFNFVLLGVAGLVVYVIGRKK